MTNITFSPECIENYQGTPEELINILNKLQQLIDSGEDFDNLASSILYTDDMKILEITL